MNNINKILWGLVFIVIGVVIGLNSFGVTNINIFFDGWWTLFIIVPCFIDLFNSKEGKTGNIIGIIIGVMLLLMMRDIISFDFIAKLIIPIIFVMIGLSMIFNNTIKSTITKKIKENKGNLESITATFGEQKVNKDDEVFKGASVDAIFGSVTVDLSKAIIENEATLSLTSIFGSIDIIVPKDVKVKVKGTPIFGGISNKANKGSEKIIYVEALCMFGGIDIK